MMKKPLILETKLMPPDCSRMIPRPRLSDLLKSSKERLTVICAEAGYGKTTLMAQYYSAYEGPGVWYQLGQNDKDMAVFQAHLLEGVRRNLPGFGQQVEAAMTRIDGAGQDWEKILTLFINELNRAYYRRFCFLLR